MNFSENLIKLRKGKGWSQEDLADKLNISRQAVSKWEVGSSKPDIDNIIKLSKLFNISIDELVNNQITDTEAISIKVKKETKAKKTLIWLRRVMIALIIIYVVNTIYKFSLLLAITSAEKKYQELNNYHYVITKYDEEGLKEKEECWFKDGVSKTSLNIYSNAGYETKYTYIDYNKKIGYIENNDLNNEMEIDIDEYMEANPYHENGGQLYSRFPLVIRNNGLAQLFYEALNFVEMDVKSFEDYIYISFNNNYVNLSKNNFQPLVYYYEEKNTDKMITTYFDIELNSVEDVEI